MFDGKATGRVDLWHGFGRLSTAARKLVVEEEQAAFRASHPVKPYHSVPPVVTHPFPAESQPSSLPEPFRTACKRFRTDGPSPHRATAVRATSLYHGRNEGDRGLPFIGARKTEVDLTPAR